MSMEDKQDRDPKIYRQH